MPVSGKESVLNGIFRVWCVPQEPKSPLVKHGQVSGDDAGQFLGTLAKDAAANCWLFFNECCYRRHNRILSDAGCGENARLGVSTSMISLRTCWIVTMSEPCMRRS